MKRYEMNQVAIHSVPRSGSTWLGELINSSLNVKYCYQPLFSYALKDFLNVDSTKHDIESFFSELYSTKDDFILQSVAREQGILPGDFKKQDITHIAYKEVRYHHLLRNMLSQSSDVKVLMLIRNPLEVMASWIRAPKEFDKSWDVDEELIEAHKKNQNSPSNFYGLAKWSEVALDFLSLEKEFPDRALIVEYSNLKNNLSYEVNTIFKFLDIRLEQQTLDFLSNSQEKHNQDAYSVFKSKQKLSSWQTCLSKKQIQTIEEFTSAKKLEKFL